MPIHLYIEHLLNIRTLSISASLPTSSTKTTHASISADKSLLTLTHEDEVASIKLPLNLSPNRESKVSLDIRPVPQKELSFRVQLEAKDGAEFTTNGLDHNSGIVVPWTAHQLTNETEICCSSCHAVVVEHGRIKLWKDLPSEGWAEMMDFWHCHKPDVPEEHHSNGEGGKDFHGAGKKLALESGVGMVDALHLLISAEDCLNANPTPGEDHRTQVICLSEGCDSILGTIDPETQGYKLHKSHLSLSTTPSLEHTAFSHSKWLSLLLLNAIETQGVRKFNITIKPGEISPRSQDKTLKLWVFTPDLLVSTSKLETDEPVRVMKVLWSEVEESAQSVGNGDSSVGEKLNRLDLTEGELEIGGSEHEKLLKALEEGNGWIPESGRKFQGWSVGLLERFSSTDLEA